MRSRMPFLLLFLLLSFSAPSLAIYKCEFAGKLMYSDLPCKEGQMKELSIAPPLSNQAEAQQRLEQDKQQLEELEARRHKQEALDEKIRQKKFKAYEKREKKCASLAQRLKWANEDSANASPKSGSKARRNAQRALEKYQLACEN